MSKLKQFIAWVLSWFGGGSSSSIHATNFLANNSPLGGSMRLMDPRNSDAEREEVISDLKAQGYTVAYVGCAMPAKTGKTEYVYSVSSPYDKATWRKWLQKLKDAGIQPILWMHGGNYPALFRWSEDTFNAHQKRVHMDLGDLALEYVQGIEVNESGWGVDRVGRHVTFLKNLSGKRVGVHTGSYDQEEYAAKADVFYVQYGFGKTANDIARITADVIRKLGSKRVIAAEYHLHGDTNEAKAMGDAAIAAGAQGVGNGCTKEGIKRLKGDKPKSSGGKTKEPRLISVEYIGNDKWRYKAEGMDGWPRKDDNRDGTNVYAVVQVNGKGVDDVADGRDWFSLSNIRGSREHGQKLVKGQMYPLRFARFNNSEFTNEVMIKWP